MTGSTAQIIKDLSWGFMSVTDYKEAVKSGEISLYRHLSDEREFESENPGHPMSASCRFKRIEAADRIRQLCRSQRHYLKPEILEPLYRSLFDCCAAVRLSILDSLFFLSYDDSLAIIRNLASQETDSPMVKERAELIAGLLGSSTAAPSCTRQIVAVTENFDLLKRLMVFASQVGSEVRWARPGTSDILTLHAAVMLVDPEFLGIKIWDRFVKYLEEADCDNTPLIILGEKYSLKRPRNNTLCNTAWNYNIIFRFIREHW